MFSFEYTVHSRPAWRTHCSHWIAAALPFVLAADILTASAAGAEQGSESAAEMQSGGLHLFDWAIIAAYGCATIGLGIYFGRRQRSAEEYFVGSGKINPFLVGVSLFATLLSTISYLSMPGEAAGKGPTAMVGMLAFPLIFLVVAYVILPVYMRQRVTSAYELLEERLGLSVRLLGATLFLVLRLVWMTLLVYLTAKAMTVMMGLDPTWIPLIVIITGVVSVIYTSLGGLRAVIVTDFMQTVLLFGGAILVIVTVSYDFGGFGWFPMQWHPNWDTQPIFSFDPQTRITVVGTILSIFAWYVATLGGDQTSVQRFMATRDLAAARRAVATQLSVGFTVQVTLFLVGFALLSYFQSHVDQLPAGMNIKDNADDLFPQYVSYHLPVGISGLVVAAMFAAAMSSIDSGVNSITAVVMTDFFKRLGLAPKSQTGNVRAAQILALTIGLTVVLGSSHMKYIEGNITAVTGKTVNLLTTPIFALFFFAMFVPRAKPLGVWIGAVCGVSTAAAIAFSGPLVYLLHTQLGLDPSVFGTELLTVTDEVTGAEWMTAKDPISFQWISPMAFIVNIAVGSIANWVLASSARPDR
jgi:SSS family solute:Na+ symporter